MRVMAFIAIVGCLTPLSLAQVSTVNSGTALESTASAPPATVTASASFRLHDPSLVIEKVELADVPADLAFAWFSRTTDVPVLVDWTALQAQGVDGQRPINLNVRMVRADQVLALMMQQMPAAEAMFDPAAELVLDETADFVQVLTKGQANGRLILRVYDVAEVAVPVPSFRSPPRMDLSSVLESAGTEGGGLTFEEADEQEPTPTAHQQGQQLADIIASTIEPSVWQQNGGPASLRYFEGRLIVNAPFYVHRQIGSAVPASRAAAPDPRYVNYSGSTASGAADNARSANAPGAAAPPVGRTAAGIGGIDRTSRRPIVGRER